MRKKSKLGSVFNYWKSGQNMKVIKIVKISFIPIKFTFTKHAIYNVPEQYTMYQCNIQCTSAKYNVPVQYTMALIKLKSRNFWQKYMRHKRYRVQVIEMKG